MLYLSEQGDEFDGGLIRFPKLKSEIVPRAGMLVGFLTGLEYQHEVTPVAHGQRDAVAFWFKTAPAAKTPCGCGGSCC